MQFTVLFRVSLILVYFRKCVSILTNAYTNKELISFSNFICLLCRLWQGKAWKIFFFFPFQITPWATQYGVAGSMLPASYRLSGTDLMDVSKESSSFLMFMFINIIYTHPSLFPLVRFPDHHEKWKFTTNWPLPSKNIRIFWVFFFYV